MHLLAPAAGAGSYRTRRWAQALQERCTGMWRWDQALRRNTRFGAGRRRWWSRTLALAVGAALSAGARRWVGAVLVGAGLALAGRVGAGLALAD